MRSKQGFKKKIFIRILSFLLPYKKYFLIGSILAFVFSIVNGATLYSVVPLFDTLSPGGEKYHIKLNRDDFEILKKEGVIHFNEKFSFYKAKIKREINIIIKKTEKFTLLVYICIFLFLIIIIRTVLKLLVVYYIGYAGYGAIRDIRQSLCQSLVRIPLDFFYKHRRGDLISRIIYDTDQISGSLSNQLRKFVINIFIVITHIAMLLYIHVELTILTFIMLVVVTIPILFLGRAFKRYSRIEQMKMSDLSSTLLESVDGIRIVKSFQMENFITRRFSKNAFVLFKKKIKKSIVDIVRPQIVENIATVFFVFLLIIGGRKLISEEYSKGEFLFFIFTFLFIMNPIKQIANMNNQINQAESAGERILDIIDHKMEVENSVYENFKGNTGNITTNISENNQIGPQREIRFENIYFKYPSSDKYVLKSIDFSIKAGKTLALVGESGAGKTTLLDMLPRFITPTSGTIYIDGKDIKKIPFYTLRNSIGIVTQDVFLFNGTILENITYGMTDIPFEKIEQTARIANAHNFIMNMPEGYNTIVGERGIIVSGGERQRIAIARSILRDPPILILDEATSSLDPESESMVQVALRRLMSSRSTFIIAHRLSTVIEADLIVILDENKISGIGTHNELLDNNDIYRKLYNNQFVEI